MKKLYILTFATGLGLVACNTTETVVKEEIKSQEQTQAQSNKTIDLDYLDQSTRPQDDFFQFANGSWIANNPVPPSESRWGSFNELDQANKEKLTSILSTSVENKENNPTDKILGNYYASFIDMEKRNQLGISPIEQDVEFIRSINSKKDLTKVILVLHQQNVGALFNFGVGQDLKDVDNHTLYMGQGGIGLPNRDYYFNEDKAEILENYREHVETVMIAYGESAEDARLTSKNVVNFEKALASKMMAPAELRIPENTYNKFSRSSVIKMLGSFNTDGYFIGTGISSFDSLVISQPDFISNLPLLLEETDLSVIKDYLEWSLINHYAGNLNDEMVRLNFNFYGTTLSGKKEMKPINERAINQITNMEFSELLGKAFVEKYYSNEAQVRVNEMVDNLLIVFEDRIKNLEWMSAETKKEALNKLNSIGRKLGFPDKWEDFTSLEFKSDDYLGNVKAEAKFGYEKNIAKLGKPVDKDEWGMPAHMVNAYYHPLLNEIAFPAGIMQPPFFSDQYEDAVNYGRIGMVIGHEFTHGFDDMGSKFAADGSFNNWWSEADRSLFEERTEKLGNTFSNFCPIDGHCVNSQLTMGENIADLGGLTLAYYAYERTAEFKAGEVKKGYTPAQRFFIGYAQLWKINYTEEELKNRIANDPHSPGMYRVNGPLMNCPEFFKAFDVKESDPMRNNSDKISKIW